MNATFLALALAVGLAVLAQSVFSGERSTMEAKLRRAGGAALMAFAVALLVTGKFLAALPFFVFALMVAGPAAGGYARWVRPFLGRWGDLFGAGRGAGGGRGLIRTAALEVEIDRKSGILSGRVLAGRYEGRELAHLSVEDLLALRRDIAFDPDGRSLLEAYLDRRVPLWRQHVDEDAAPGQSRPARPGAMTDEEAHQILGLRPGASEAEVRAAHRRLMKAVHPDRGGSNFLAAEINAAKDRLIGNHRGPSGH